jgi:hypothetical protein
VSDDETIEVGDTVWVGTGHVHWVVLRIREGDHNGGGPRVLLRSGMSGRTLNAWLRHLRLHSKGTS